MNFPIIKLEPINLPKEDWDINLDYEDSILNKYTDYYGKLYTEEERRAVITSNWLKELFRGIATVDEENETITFLDFNTIQQTLRQYYADAIVELQEKLCNNRIEGYDFRRAGRKFRDFDTLFYLDYGKTSLDMIEYGKYYPNESFRIGNIFDAHS